MRKRTEHIVFVWSLIVYMTVISVISGKIEPLIQTLQLLIYMAVVAYILSLCNKEVKKVFRRIIK